MNTISIYHKATLAAGMAIAALLLVVSVASAKSGPGTWKFDIYDNTEDGLQVDQDPVVGSVVANPNPGDQDRIIAEIMGKDLVPNCTYRVEFVQGSASSNGGLNEFGHSGSPMNVASLTTNGQGKGNAHADFEAPGIADADGYAYGHFDIEVDLNPEGPNPDGCVEDIMDPDDPSDDDMVVANEYGAAPDPAMNMPFAYMPMP